MEFCRLLKRQTGFNRISVPNESDDICGTALQHFELGRDKKISVYLAGGDVTPEEIAIAVAMRGDSVEDVEYVLIAEDLVRRVVKEIVPSPGNTGSPKVDQVHHDLCRMAVHDVASITILAANEGHEETYSSTEFVRALCEMLEKKQIASTSINVKIIPKILSTRAYKNYERERNRKVPGIQPLLSLPEIEDGPFKLTTTEHEIVNLLKNVKAGLRDDFVQKIKTGGQSDPNLLRMHRVLSAAKFPE